MAIQRPAQPIRFASVTFDPLTEEPVDTPPVRARAPRAAMDERTVVQFTGPLTREEQARLKRVYGLRLQEYVPEHAYLERLKPEVLAKLQEDAQFRAAVRYRPEFKIAPRIGQRRFTTKERQELKGLWLRVVLFRDADLKAVAQTLKRLGARDIKINDDRPRGGDPKIHFVVNSADVVPAIAALA